MFDTVLLQTNYQFYRCYSPSFLENLGIKNILLGPTLPAFISPNVLKILVENYAIAPISTPEEDLKKILGN